MQTLTNLLPPRKEIVTILPLNLGNV